MTEETVSETRAEEQGQQVQMVPAATLALAVVNGNVVGCEVVWNEQTVMTPDAAALALNVFVQSQNDVRWTVRQVMRAQAQEQKPN